MVHLDVVKHDGVGRLLYRVRRDLRAPMAILVATEPERRVIRHQGFEDDRPIRRLVSVDPTLRRTDGKRLATHDEGIGSWAAAAVDHGGRVVGTLFVADRRRRWFDDEEVRHLALISASAGRLIAEATTARRLTIPALV